MTNNNSGSIGVVNETIMQFPNQLRQAWDEVGAIDFPQDFKNINKIALCGMGGSALGGRVVDSLFVNRIRMPFEIFNQYHVPNYTDSQTLIISYSYSGNTEEAVSCLYEAFNRDAKTFVISAGGKLAEIAEKHTLPSYLINPKFNPSRQPRNATGYAIGSILSLLVKLGVSQVTHDEIENSTSAMTRAIDMYSENTPTSDNLAATTAKELKDKGLIMVASEHLVGAVHTVKNQVNESAKTFSTIFELPELNHHLMEGLAHPKSLKQNLHFWFFRSGLYDDRVQRRYPLTEKVVAKNGFGYNVYTPFSESRIEQVFEILIFGSFVVYYLAKIYDTDPNTIPYVDWFKKELAKQ